MAFPLSLLYLDQDFYINNVTKKLVHTIFDINFSYTIRLYTNMIISMEC